ncbi:MAG: conjugative transfer signal peptidase TraF [Acetobacteraceae bacterium]
MTGRTAAGVGAFLIAGGVLAGGGYAHIAGYRLNTTPSLPMGLWRQTSTAPVRLARGEVVTFCPPASAPFELGHRRGYIAPGGCPSGLELMMKPIAALPGDTVTVSTAGIAVDGTPIAHSRPLSRDNEGRPLRAMAAGTYAVPAGEIWLVSSFNSRSYDSRYFGPVPITAVRALARPILTDDTP